MARRMRALARRRAWDVAAAGTVLLAVWLVISLLDADRVANGAVVLAVVAFDVVLVAALSPVLRWVWRNRPSRQAQR